MTRVSRTALEALVGEPVRITWEDAVALAGKWLTTEKALRKQLVTVVSVGHCVGLTPTALVLAGDRQADVVNAAGLIPLAWILRAEQLVPAPGA